MAISLAIESETDEDGNQKRVPWRVVSVHLESRLHALAWVLKHQAGRRNLSRYVRSLLAAELEEALKVLAEDRAQEGRKKGGEARATAERDDEGRFAGDTAESSSPQKTAGSKPKIKPAKKKGAKSKKKKKSNPEGEARVQAAKTFDVSETVAAQSLVGGVGIAVDRAHVVGAIVAAGSQFGRRRSGFGLWDRRHLSRRMRARNSTRRCWG